MAPLNKRTLSAVLVLVTVMSDVQCLSKPEDHEIISTLPAEHLLRGSNVDDKRPSGGSNAEDKWPLGDDIVTYKTPIASNISEDKKPSVVLDKVDENKRLSIDNNTEDGRPLVSNTAKDETPAVGNKTQYNRPQETITQSVNTQMYGNDPRDRTTVFFNTENSKSVRMTDRDLITDPTTGQTVIKHITKGNEEMDYIMRQTDVPLKNLQGFYVAGEVLTTEPVEMAQVKLQTGVSTVKNYEEAETEFTDQKLNEDLINTELTTPAAIHDEATVVPADMITETVLDWTASTNDSRGTHTNDDKVVNKQESSYNLGTEINNRINTQHETTLEGASTVVNKETTDATPAAQTTEVLSISSRIGAPEGLGGPVVDTVGRSLEDNKVSAVPLRRTDPPPRPKVKLSKRDTLRAWLQDAWLRAPIALLLPLRTRSVARALALWSEVSQPEGLNLTDVLVIGYDDNGIGWMSKHSTSHAEGIDSVTNALQKLLHKYQSLPPRETGDAALHACALASGRVPYDSALFIVTDTAPSDAHRLPAALRAIIEKRLKLYTIWTDPLYPSPASEQAVADLKKASKNTEGEFLDYHPALGTSSYDSAEMIGRTISKPRADQTTRAARTEGGTREKYETLLVRRINGGGPASLGVPVETGVESLRVRIDGRIDRAALYPPTGSQVDLLNAAAVSQYSSGSRLESESPLEAVLFLPKKQDIDGKYTMLPADKSGQEASHKKSPVGLWRLSVRCSGCEYRVVVTAQARVGLDVTVLGDDMLRLRARGPIASIRETALVDEYGTELARLPFSHQPAATEEGLEGSITRLATPPTLAADVPIPPVKRSSKVYAKILGRDVYGESFTRVAGPIFKGEIRTSRSASISFPDDRANSQRNMVSFPEEGRPDRNQRLVGYNETSSGILNGTSTAAQISSSAGTLLTAVQIGLSSKLYGSPGENLQLHFEVTNYRDRTVNFRFEASGNLRFLRGIRPSAQWVNAGQTVNVIVDVGITAGAQAGARDLITFRATGLEQVSISAYVYVTGAELQLLDTWAPEVRHSFQGDCIGKTGADCSRHTWAVTVFARDPDGGLLRISSSPVGIRYENSFTAGTREEVQATYRATCCATRLLVNAVDANGNANTYTLDIAYYIPDAAIAAIVLGILLLIALIALIVFLVLLCLRRRKESRQLPSYATSRRETS